MKRILWLVLISALLFSCKTMSPVKTDTWLDGKRDAVAGFNIAGKWDCGPYMEGGWGEGIFTQVGNRVSGTLGPYNVDGIIDGKTFFMAIQGGTKLYTAKLSLQPDGQLVGTYVFNNLIDGENASGADTKSISMKRMNQ